MRIRVLLVDDHQLMREGLRALLESATDIEVVGEASNGRTAVDLAGTLEPHVVVMDIALPELNGIEATRQIRAAHRSVRVVALSTHSDKRYVQQMLEAGACGYVVKIAAYTELLQAVRAASLGHTFLSPHVSNGVVERSLRERGAGVEAAISTLSPLERYVLKLVAEGKTSAESAQQLQISIKAIETHRRNICRKVGLHGTAELTKYAIREGLTALGD
jgi:DNA-binding NarL/FixJ family response regulator